MTDINENKKKWVLDLLAKSEWTAVVTSTVITRGLEDVITEDINITIIRAEIEDDVPEGLRQLAEHVTGKSLIKNGQEN